MSVEAIFAALADPTRRSIFDRVVARPGTVSQLAADLPVTRSAVSQHLKVLLDAGLVECEAQGRRRHYRSRRAGLDALRDYARDPGASLAASPEEVAAPYAIELSKWQEQAPHIDHSALALLMYFTRIGQYIMRANENVAREVRLNFGEVAVLGALRRLGPPYESTPSKLANTFWITLPGMTKRLTNLQRIGLVSRRSDPDDGRAVILRLTERGLALLRELIAGHQPLEYHALLGLSPNERRQLLSLLPRLLEDIEQRHGDKTSTYVVHENGGDLAGR